MLNLKNVNLTLQKSLFLGYILSKDGLKVDPEKVKAILDWPVPSNVKEIQSFIGLCNYYRIFIKDFAKCKRKH